MQRAVADRATYFQTGAAAQFLMLGIPTLQVGIRLEDTEVRSGLASSITEGKALAEALLNTSNPPLTPEKLDMTYALLGIKPSWLTILISTLNESGQLGAVD